MRTIPILTTAALLSLSFAVQAANHTIMAGYAATDIKNAKDKLHGLTVKYRYEGASRIGLLASATVTTNEDKEYTLQPGIKFVESGKTTSIYSSLHLGPTYRFNDFVSGYATLGYAEYSVERKGYGLPKSTSEDESFAIGAGVDFNVTRSLVINTGVELSEHFSDAKATSYSLSLGYRF